MEMIIVEAAPRSDRGKNAARRTRVSGHTPAVIYGGKGEAEALALNTKQVTAILRSASGHNTIFKVKLASGEQPAMVRDWQVDPVKGHLLHVDLMRVSMDVRMRVKVPVHTFGEPQGVKLQGGIFEMVTREVEIECLPGEIPTEFRVDVTELMIGKHLRASDLPLDPEKMKLVSDPQRVIAHVVALRVEEEKPAEAVAEAAATPAEPEVIKKGKKEAEEGEEGEGEAAPAEKKK
jgi:large subunit ribosomal protein L25